MDTPVFDCLKVEKQRAISRFNRSRRRLARLRQILEALAVLLLVSWSSARAPGALRSAAACLVRFSASLSSQYVVFLVGNAIIVALFALRRHGGGTDSRVEAVKTKYTHRQTETEVIEEKQIVVYCHKEEAPKGDEVKAAVQLAAKRIEKFQRSESEKLKREITVRPAAELRKSATLQGRKAEGGWGDMERLSSQEFRRAVDDFIEKNWRRNLREKHQLLIVSGPILR